MTDRLEKTLLIIVIVLLCIIAGVSLYEEFHQVTPDRTPIYENYYKASRALIEDALQEYPEIEDYYTFDAYNDALEEVAMLHYQDSIQ